MWASSWKLHMMQFNLAIYAWFIFFMKSNLTYFHPHMLIITMRKVNIERWYSQKGLLLAYFVFQPCKRWTVLEKVCSRRIILGNVCISSLQTKINRYIWLLKEKNKLLQRGHHTELFLVGWNFIIRKKYISWTWLCHGVVLTCCSYI